MINVIFVRYYNMYNTKIQRPKEEITEKKGNEIIEKKLKQKVWK